MEFKFIYLIIIGAIALFNYFRKLKEKQREAEKKFPVPPSRTKAENTPKPQTPRVETLEDILKRAGEEARRERAEKQLARQQQQQRQQTQMQTQRTWVSDKAKPAPRKASSPFLTQDNAEYRNPQMETITSLEGSSLETVGEEGGISISDVHQRIETVTLDETTPTINLRQAMLYQVILERPEY